MGIELSSMLPQHICFEGLRHGGAALRNPFRVEGLLATVTQGSRFAALRDNPGLPYHKPFGLFCMLELVAHYSTDRHESRVS
jgi:hypothetical protein